MNILRYAVKMGKMEGQDPRFFFDSAVEGVLGQEGIDFLNGIIPAGARFHRPSTMEFGEEETEEP